MEISLNSLAETLRTLDILMIVSEVLTKSKAKAIPLF